MKKSILILAFSLCAHLGFAQVDHIDIKALLDLVNIERAKSCRCGGKKQNAVGSLTWNETLAKAAKNQAEYLVKKKGISHTGAFGSSPSSRVSKLGYKWSWVGENIAKGQESLEEVIKAWMKSPPHCKNIMNGNFTEFGAAIVLSKDGQLIWVQVFATKAT